MVHRHGQGHQVHVGRRRQGNGDTLRQRALAAIDETTWVPASGENRMRGMIENRPDWVVSRQRAWGVPITVFVDKETGEVLRGRRGQRAHRRGLRAGGRRRLVRRSRRRALPGARATTPADFEKVDDILDVWFDSGSTHAFTLEVRDDLKTKRRPRGGR